MPTHTQQDVENKITRPDYVTLTGGTVISGYRVTNTLNGAATEQQRNPGQLEISNIPGNSNLTVKWIVRGNGPCCYSWILGIRASHRIRTRGSGWRLGRMPAVSWEQKWTS